ncbi:MAG: hypothetical protein Q9162_004816 [Coniocarpon cinnabarinum]
MNEPYVPRSPDLSALHANQAAGSSYTRPRSNPYAPSHPQYASQQQNPSAYQYNGVAAPLYKPSPDFSSYNQQPHISNFHLPPSNGVYPSAWTDQQQQQQYHAQQAPRTLNQQFQPYAMPRGRQTPDDAEYVPQNDYSSHQQPFVAQPSFTSQPEPTKPPPGEEEGITVKTKFPVARIKRIVQADDEVGKVAQSTPVAVSKALELFMISLALRSADVARERGSKKVTGACLKAVVGQDEQFDFLSEIVSKIQDGGGAGGGGGGGDKKKGREASESEERAEEESDEDYGASKRRKGAARAAKSSKRKKMSESEED